MAYADIFSPKYDTIVSLGNSCVVAIQLKENNIYNVQSPFDWLTSQSTPNVAKQISQNFSELFLPENLQFSANQKALSATYIVEDKVSGFRSFHDIPKVNAPDKPFEVLHQKHKHKTKSLLTKIEAGNKILFVRLLSEGEDDSVMISLFGEWLFVPVY